MAPTLAPSQLLQPRDRGRIAPRGSCPPLRLLNRGGAGWDPPLCASEAEPPAWGTRSRGRLEGEDPEGMRGRREGGHRALRRSPMVVMTVMAK